MDIIVIYIFSQPKVWDVAFGDTIISLSSFLFSLPLFFLNKLELGKRERIFGLRSLFSSCCSLVQKRKEEERGKNEKKSEREKKKKSKFLD